MTLALCAVNPTKADSLISNFVAQLCASTHPDYAKIADEAD
jgi:hypothetical protein